MNKITKTDGATKYQISRYRDGVRIGFAHLTTEQRVRWDAMTQQPEGLVRLGSLPHAYYDLDEQYQDTHEDTTVFIDD